MGVAPDVDRAREAMRRGASLEEAAIIGGFSFAADLDVALWAALPGQEIAEAQAKIDADRSARGLARWSGERYPVQQHVEEGAAARRQPFLRACASAGLTDQERAEVRELAKKLCVPLADAIPYVVRSRKPAGAAR